MVPLHLAPVSGTHCGIAALRSQHMNKSRYLYIFTPESSILAPGYIRVAANQIVGQAGLTSPVARVKNNWRKTCRTASNPCWPSVSSRWSRPVPTLRRSKSTSWLTPRRSRKSLCTPASTSNSALTGWRAAMRPANHRHLSPREEAVC